MGKMTDKLLKMSKKSKQTNDDAKWVTWVDNNIKEHPIRREHHPKMAIAKNFYKGEQYKMLDEETGVIHDVKVNRETRSKANFTKIFLRVWSSKMLAGNPIPQFAAHEGNTEDFDNDVAGVAQDLCTVISKKENFRKKNMIDVKNAGVVGFGVSKTYFDKTGGESIAELYGVEDDLKTGVVRRESINPFHFYLDPTATSMDNARWACHRYPIPVTTAEEAFDKPKGYFKADDKTEDRTDIRDTTIVDHSYSDDEGGDDNEIVFIHDIYVRSNRDYKEGKHVVVVSNETVVNEPNPEGRDLPFDLLKINADEDEFAGTSYAYDLMGPQRDYNKANSTIMENAEWTGFHKLYQNRRNNYSEITNDAVGIIEGDSDIPPSYLQAKPLPDYLVKNPDRIFEIAQTIMNLHNVDFSQIPTRGTNSSGKVIDELKESSRVAFAEDIGNIKEYIQSYNLRVLKLCQKYFTIDEIAKIIGENKRDRIKKFMKVKFTPTSFDMAIRIAEGFAQSPSTKFEQGMQMFRDGVFDSHHVDKIMKLLDNNGNLDALTENYLADERKAKHNLELVKTGKTPEKVSVSQYDNHETHKKVFIDFIKSPEWYDLDDDKKLALDNYISTMDVHQLANLQREAKKQMVQQQMMQASQQNQNNPAMLGNGNPVSPTAADAQQTEENRHKGGVFANELERTPYLQNNAVV